MNRISISPWLAILTLSSACQDNAQVASTAAQSEPCGNATLDAGEVCDDGDANGRYGHCAEDCLGRAPACGDGHIDVSDGELCDDGTHNGLRGFCASNCLGLTAFCGDGNVDADDGEHCDDGEDNGAFGFCRSDCTLSAFPPPPYPNNVDSGWLSDPPACSSDNWLAKYLRYRIRLRGDGTAQNPGFVSIGPGAGQSIPATYRNPDTDCGNDWYLSDAGCPEPGGLGKYDWGDATIWLGEYLATLATEYAMFDQLGVDTTTTTSDLYYALMAFNRVDEAAEVPYGTTPQRDGFFLRDDVPAGFQRNPDGTFRFPREDSDVEGYGCVSSTSACGDLKIDDGSFVSQDQAVGMVYGLGFVARLLPSGVSYNGMDLRQEARAQVHRIVKHLRDHGWRVTDPHGDHPPDAWGGNAIGLSSRLAAAANALCGNEFGVPDYRDIVSNIAGETAFSGMMAIWDVTHGYNRTMALRMMTVTNEWNSDEMAKYAAGDAKEVFALAHAVLNNTGVGAAISPWRIESILTQAPCAGPCNYTDGCTPSEGWAGQSRWSSPQDRTISTHHPAAEFNGLDYMLVHNLYFLFRNGAYGFSPSSEPAIDCNSHRGLDQILATGSVSGEIFDPQSPCHAADYNRIFCGRSFAAWLDDAYSGKAHIFTAGAQWLQQDDGTFVLTTAGEQNTQGVDLILGSAQADVLHGSGGDDCIYGLGGNDELSGGRGRDELHGGEGDDLLYGDSHLAVEGEPDVLWGELGSDTLFGGFGSDELYGGADDDTLNGGDGDDHMVGHAGDDHMEGGLGDDHMRGGTGNDALWGNAGEDAIFAEEGRDKADGGAGADRIHGADGDDFIRGGGGNDTLIGSNNMEGADRLCGDDGDDTIWGNWSGTTTCLGGDGNNQVNGCTDGSASTDDCGDAAFSAW